MNRFDKYIEDKSMLEESMAIVQLLQQLNSLSNCGYDLPHIILPKDFNDNLRVFIMEKASGMPLKKLIENLDKMDEHRINTIFEKIGQKHGNLQRLTYEHYNKQFIKHGDAHNENIFYDEMNDKVYWIDALPLSFIDFDIYNIFDFRITRKFTEYNISEFKDLIKARDIYRKRWIALKALHIGFIKAFKGTDIFEDLRDSFNHRESWFNYLVQLNKDLSEKNIENLDINEFKITPRDIP